MPRLFLLTLLLAPALLFAGNDKPLSDEEILKHITWPKDDYDATVFCAPPQLSYAIFLSSAPDGTLFIGCDGNGSLDREPGRGKVVMARDTKGAGKADVLTDFCKVDSPRGVAWDGSTRTLYVVHPPNVTAYHDDGNTGVATRQEDLVTGLGFGLDFRGADHTTNGCRLGIDGWLYIAVGDYGAVKATGKDGRSLSMRGGGVVRVRPDGTGLEQVVFGTRNVLSVALSPTMEIFARDNTNDGDDWNDRLSHFPFGAQMGYPILFRHFADEIIPALYDFGGGSPVGSLFLDEPSQPKAWAYGFYSVEWGRGEVDLHPLTPSGATWKAETKQFLKLTRPTDLEADGVGHLYVASWEGATFTNVGPNVGYVIRLTPKGLKPMAAPDLRAAPAAALYERLGGDSGVWRLAAQRELLRRGVTPETERALTALVREKQNPGARAAALYTLAQLEHAQAVPFLQASLQEAELRPLALKVLGDDAAFAAAVPEEAFIPGLRDADPRVRLQAVTGLGHLGKAGAARHLLPLTADPDHTVAHLAVQELIALKADDLCLQALGGADAKLLPGALRVLQHRYVPAVVAKLIGDLEAAGKSGPEQRIGLFKTLCRLNFQEAPYTDPKMWWGTRPDTSGPIFKPEPWSETPKIQAALESAFKEADGAPAREMIVALLQHKITFPGLTEMMMAKAGTDAGSRMEVLKNLVSSKAPTAPEVLDALTSIAVDPAEQPAVRVQALRLLMGTATVNSGAAMKAFLPLAATEQQGILKNIWEEYTRDPRHVREVGTAEKFARDPEPAHRTLGATVLVNLATSPVVKDAKVKEAVTKAIDALWDKPLPAATLLSVIGKTNASAFAPQVREHLNDPDHTVAEAAEFALTKLGLDKGVVAAGRPILERSYDEVVKIACATKGDAQKGQQLFLQQGCVVCHTLSAKEPPKGPMLAGIATRYTRPELCESILKPSAKIAQGFESQSFVLKNKQEILGFVTREGGDSVDVRDIAGTSTTIEKAEISKREKRETSIMPEGLVGNLTPEDLASLIAFLESTKSEIAPKK